MEGGMEGVRGKWEYIRAAQHGEFSDGSEGGEGMEEEQQSLAQIEQTREWEILHVPAAIWWAAKPQYIYAPTEREAQRKAHYYR